MNDTFLPETDRRGFLKALGLGIGASASLAACSRMPVKHAMPFLVPPEGITPGVAVHYASTCTACPASCGLLVTVLDGRPVKLEGRPDHPLSGGGLCALGQADIRALYDAGRLRAPRLSGKDTTWKELDAHVASELAALKASGKRLHVVAPTLVSPTLRQAVDAFLAPHGGVLVEHDPGPRTASATLEAYELLDGRPALPALDLAKVDLLVVFGADLLGAGLEPVTHTQAYAARRRQREERGALRHVQVEGSLSLTGAAADERWTATSAERRALALGLLAAVAEASGDAGLAGSLPRSRDPRVAGLAAALGAHRGRSLVVSGGDVPERLAAALLNRLLGNEGATLDLTRPSLVARGRDGALAGFLESLERGEVGGVVFLELDPVEQLPGGEKLGEALRKLPLSIAITDRPTATAAACRVVASAHHGLERWGDAEPRPGLVTLAQPSIRALFDTRHPLESILTWSGSAETDARRHLMAAWGRRLGEGLDWTAAVRKGELPTVPVADPLPAAPAAPDALLAALSVGGSASARPEPAGELEIELLEEVALRDGRRAHVPWLRELPDPLTRSSWVACARVAPALARRLGVVDGDVLRLDAGGRTITLPARLVPGQHPGVIGVPVGYAEANAYQLARFSGGRLVTEGLAASAVKTAARERLPLMQTEGLTHGRPIVHQVTPASPEVHRGHEPHRSLWPDRPPGKPSWEMVIDLDACTGCNACVVSCQAENNLPVVGAAEMQRSRDMYWLRMDRYFVGDEANPDVLFSPMLCAQCGNAPCETVCPVAATVHSEDGLNQQVYNRCVGTRYCANNCPYKVRRFNWFDHEIPEPIERMVLNPNVVVRERGVMEKCTFCVQRIQLARLEARAGGSATYEPQTACQQSCPARAITFGDASDPAGAVARAKGSPRAFQVLDELGVKPSVTYLARVRNREGAGPAGEGTHA